MRIRRFFALAIGFMAIAALVSIDCQAQIYGGGQKTRSLISQPIDETRLVKLAGNTHPSARAENDRGMVDDSFPMDHMQLVLQRPPELEKQLESFMEDQQRKGSPDYHHWLTGEEFADRYGVASADIEKVTSWLQEYGFRVDSVLPNGMAIEFSGTAGQVKQAFHTEIHNLEVKGVAHFANMTDPRIPAALTGVVKGVHALHNFMPHPQVKKRTEFNVAFFGGAAQAIVPADLATIYNLNPAFSNGITGKGQTIAVVEDSLLANVNDVATFRSAFGLSGYSGTFRQETAYGPVSCANSGVRSDVEYEAALDAEWAGASAPDANIVLASCQDAGSLYGPFIALQNLIFTPNPPQIISISYSVCEADYGDASDASFVNMYQEAAARGISIFVAAGDQGAASCDYGEPVATQGIAVNGFASTPYNVAVGGTDFGDTYASLQPNGLPLSTYWSASNAVGTDGSALSYIPEIPWNDSCASELLYSVNGYSQSYGSTGFCNSATGKAFRTTYAGGGGPSTYEVGRKPAWQSVLGNPNDNTRDLPDVSLFAANGVWNHFLLACMSDTLSRGAPCDYTNIADVTAQSAGGTSFAAPIMAGIQALINQSTGQNAYSGNPTPRYYALGNMQYDTDAGAAACNSTLGTGESSTCVFNDVTLGDIDVNCTGTINCYGSSGTGSDAVDGALSTSTSDLSIAYGANSGWDFATGLGSVNVWNMIQNWTSVGTRTAVAFNANTILFGQPVTFTATITPNIGSGETGTVSWSANTGCAISTVSAGQATCTTSALPSGASTVTATYSGDSNYSGSNGSITATTQSATAVGTAPSGLAFSVDGTAYTSTQSFTWAIGSLHSLSTTPTQTGPGAKYAFAGWSDGTANVAVSVTASGSSARYTANFNASYQLNIAANSAAYGTVTPASGPYYPAGTSVAITATANPGYYFTGWTGSADINNTTSSSTTITMNGPESITANFAPIPSYQLNIAPNNAAWGSVTPPSGTSYTIGTVVPLTATANLGYYFTGWTGGADISSTANPSTTITMNGPESITGNFAPIPNLVVNTAADDFGADSPSNCSPQPTPGTTTTADTCTLRDASDYANFFSGAANISFDSTVFNAANTAAQNTITLSGGEIDILANNISITGPTTGAGATLTNLVTVSGGNSVLDFYIGGATAVSINNLNIVDGDGSSFGTAGGIFSAQSTVSINGCVVSGNVESVPNGYVAPGGGITNSDLSTMTVSNSTISGNTAADNGGDGFSLGGGIANFSATLTVINSTISGNTASAVGGDAAAGGGIANDGGTLTVANSTISGNSALAGGNGYGGGIYNYGPMNLTGITVTLNSADFGSGLEDDTTGGSNPVANSILTGNTGQSSFNLVQQGSLLDNGGNQISTGVAPAPLANYGGTTQSQLPLPGDPSICGGLAGNAIGTTDQRGLPFDPACPSGLVDSGAVQTNFAIAFSTEPASTVGVNVPFLPVPTVELTESGNLLAPSAGPIVMTDKKNRLGGTTSENTNAGYAAFNALTLSKAESGDTLTASLTLGYPAVLPQAKPAPKTKLVANANMAKPQKAPTPISITADSSAFNARASQTITFAPLPANIVVGMKPIALSATSTSGLNVTFTVISGPGRISGTNLFITGAGTVTVAADQAGNPNYGAAPEVTQTVVVN